jgi:hypothetical protein
MYSFQWACRKYTGARIYSCQFMYIKYNSFFNWPYSFLLQARMWNWEPLVQVCPNSVLCTFLIVWFWEIFLCLSFLTCRARIIIVDLPLVIISRMHESEMLSDVEQDLLSSKCYPIVDYLYLLFIYYFLHHRPNIIIYSN